MIKFFRKIRQKLLSENKFSKYLIYAIGEIVLVVIGILIALQINNWNENRKNENQGIIQKKALKIELENDLETFKSDLDYVKKELKINKSYAKRLSSKTSNLDTLVKIVRYEFDGTYNSLNELNKTTFNSLESTSKLGILGDDLAKNIQNYYNTRDNGIEILSNNRELYFSLLELTIPKYPTNWSSIQGHLQDIYWEKINKNTLYGDFNGLLTMRIFNLDVRKRVVEDLITKTNHLLKEL
ncbi:DUF6090 family protein [Winogradskyella jejuensis]|uniref:Uncharacterized protein n=1 Tax=Winogradskyella jejuensis TaxID=1089305 RepID=A0A1M5S8A1_9FLAO|nr:DUF6090 family protein [Winogradskyella jejuensis]SHH34847.1 hypothetical protein SAMN05444148_1800 [Winogradskyella jejuensis]